MLPKRFKREKMRVRETQRRVYQTHRGFVRKHSCCVPGCEQGPIEFAHLRTSANSGMGLKPSDAFGISLCLSHHHRAHDIGHDAMARENGITIDYLFKLAIEFVKRSPDKALREAMKEHA